MSALRLARRRTWRTFERPLSGPTLNVVRKPYHPRVDPGVDEVGDIPIVVRFRLVDRRRMHPGLSAKGVLTKDRIVRVDLETASVRVVTAVRRQSVETLVELSRELQIDEEEIEWTVARSLADAEQGGVNSIDPGGRRGERVGERQARSR